MKTFAPAAMATIALSLLQSTNAQAQCAFNSGVARGIRTSMVRAYMPCPGSPGPSMTNTETSGAVPACTPVLPAEIVWSDSTRYKYGDAGSCSVQTKVKMVADCAGLQGSDGASLGLPPRACHVTFVKSKCKGILGDDDQPIGAGDGVWTLATVSRATLDDRLGGDMTVIDFPTSFEYSVPENGSMYLNSSSAEVLIPLVDVGGAALPACTSIELLSVKIKDPDLAPFAVPGVATRR